MTTQLIRDTGFVPEDWAHGYTRNPRHIAGENGAGLILTPDTANLSDLAQRLPSIGMIRVEFSSFADGRGFTLGRQLRLAGYDGRLRAAGPLVADQYAMARRAGFDEVEIPASLAERQPEADWLFRADWRDHDFQSRLRSAA
ncbi:DUF934 domain-containing protein [Alisedimentitalea sp. MJ-SS2]|uniref:DUF934 domain-containing protein n=1 Tax=Aliisedimentitalea sp. MJ-SS2 TaxID=3049795 RepID=UPI00290914C7|nr:DUF934 domain-containing protein [Alisedimentitalea sp. MJ-SS2]MDU8926700.1 DUF934 domain-containing protein [Alisedimentitalea sp. MJ-SS2]